MTPDRPDRCGHDSLYRGSVRAVPQHELEQPRFTPATKNRNIESECVQGFSDVGPAAAKLSGSWRRGDVQVQCSGARQGCDVPDLSA
jgi:hypothetical protein